MVNMHLYYSLLIVLIGTSLTLAVSDDRHQKIEENQPALSGSFSSDRIEKHEPTLARPSSTDRIEKHEPTLSEPSPSDSINNKPMLSVTSSEDRVEKTEQKLKAAPPKKSNRVAGLNQVQRCGQQKSHGEQEGYYCGQMLNGQNGRYGIRFYDNNNFYCGEFQNGEPSGKGYIYYDNSGQNAHYCGDVVKGQAHGYGSYQFFNSKELSLGRYINNARDGSSISYWPHQDTSAKGWYTGGQCKSAVWYNPNGAEISRNANSCRQE